MEIEKGEKRQLARPHSKTLRSEFMFWTAVGLAAALTTRFVEEPVSL